MGSTGTGLASHFHPSRPCVPSQNGRFNDIPHRHRDIAGLPVKSHSTPLTSTSEIGPSTRNGPFGRTVILTACSDIGSVLTLTNRDEPSITNPQPYPRDPFAGAPVTQVPAGPRTQASRRTVHSIETATSVIPY